MVVWAAAYAATAKVSSLRLRLRHVNQGETWQVEEMALEGKVYRASLPADYTDSPFPLQYHFECHESSGAAWLFPGLNPGWQGQPYFVLHAV
ncbi:MAG TPA: hypothetical protein VN578_00085 [Candidatus Binatia bacterium]|nr:hypothetical protein [Candidatus Binatia bacterium]